MALTLRLFKNASLSSPPTCNTTPSCPCAKGSDVALLPIVGTAQRKDLSSQLVVDLRSTVAN